MLEQLFEKLNNLREVLVHELKDMYDAEEQIIAALPKMIEKAARPELSKALSDHLEQTRTHVARLEDVFRTLGVEPQRQSCAGIKGILSEGSSVVGKVPERGPVCDAVIIEACQKVEHYEISAYGSLCAFAMELGETRVADVLQATLGEEKSADGLLTRIAQDGVNTVATRGDRSGARPGRAPDKTTL